MLPLENLGTELLAFHSHYYPNFSRFDTRHERDSHPPSQTERQTPYAAIGRAYAEHRDK